MSEKTTIGNPKEKALTDLTNGKKKPENDFEKKLQSDIQKIKDSGRIVDIPSDI